MGLTTLPKLHIKSKLPFIEVFQEEMLSSSKFLTYQTEAQLGNEMPSSLLQSTALQTDYNTRFIFFSQKILLFSHNSIASKVKCRGPAAWISCPHLCTASISVQITAVLWHFLKNKVTNIDPPLKEPGVQKLLPYSRPAVESCRSRQRVFFLSHILRRSHLVFIL